MNEAAQHAQHFLSQLYPAESPGCVALWTLEDQFTCWFQTADLHAVAAEAVRLADSRNVYFGVGLQPRALGPKQ